MITSQREVVETVQILQIVEVVNISSQLTAQSKDKSGFGIDERRKAHGAGRKALRVKFKV